jgi:alginate O-acetyltransferase complex protein AlgJ
MESHTGIDLVATEVDFRKDGNLRDFAHDGFSDQELFGAWSLGRESAIVLPCPGGNGDVELTATVLPCMDRGAAQGQILEILVEGVSVYREQLEDWTNVKVTLARDVLGNGNTTRLVFRHPTPVVPAHGGRSSDIRELGFMFRMLKLTEGATVAAPAATPQAAAPFMLSPFLTSQFIAAAVKPAQLAADPPETPPTPPVASSPDVTIGRDGWLFLVGGSNNALRYYTDASYFTDDHAESWANLLRRRHARLGISGVRYLHIAAPDKISVYPDYLDMKLPNFERHPIRLLEERLIASGQEGLLINPLGAFAAHEMRDSMYLKTDTHWSYYAGLVVLEMVLRRIGMPRQIDISTRQRHSYTHVFDLGAKLQPQISEETFAISTLPCVERFHANAQATLFEQNVKRKQPVTHGGINVAFRNTSADAVDQVVVIFGDSFMDFQASNATVIFAEHFREVHFVWSASIDYAYVARVGADIVISETAERFMITVPGDDYDLAADEVRRMEAQSESDSSSEASRAP